MNLDINIVSARDLTEVDPTSKTKLYVVVSIIGAAQKDQRAQTHVDGGGGNPTWNFPVKFAVDVEGLKQDLKTRLVFALKCEDGRGERDLGEVHVAIAELMQSGGDGNFMRYAAVSYPIRKSSGQTMGLLNFEYKFGGSPMIDTPTAGYATSMGVYPPQGYNYPPPQQAAGYGGYPPPAAGGYGGYQPPSQPSDPYLPSSPSHYTPPAYPPYNVGPTPTPSYYPPTYPYPLYNVGLSAASGYPYAPYNVGPSTTPSYAHPYAPHPGHMQARASPVEQRSTPKKKKSVWGSALGVAGAVAVGVGVLTGVATPSFELPSVPAPDVTDLTAGFQIPDPSAYAPQDFSFINTFDPSALRDATYVDYSSLV